MEAYDGCIDKLDDTCIVEGLISREMKDKVNGLDDICDNEKGKPAIDVPHI